MRLLLRLADRISHAILLSFMAAVIVLAVVTSLLRYYMPQADLYRNDLLAVLSQRTGLVIEADKLDARWHSFRPDIRLHHVSIQHEAAGHHLSLNFLRVEINIAKSLFYRRLYLDTLEADQLDIALLQNEQGQWGFAPEQSPQSAPVAVDRVVDHFWSVDTLNLSGMRLSMTPYNESTLVFPEVSASLQTWLNEKILQVDIHEQQQQRSRLIVQTQQHIDDADFSASFYWQTSDFPLHVFLSLINQLQVPEESRISHEIWLQWQNRKLSGSGSFVIDQLRLQHGDKQWQADQATGSFYLEQENSATVLAIPSLSTRLNQQPLQLDKIKLQWGEQWSLQMQQLDLAQVSATLQLMPLPPVLQELRDDLHPSGYLNNIHVAADDAGDFLLRANLQAVTAGAWKGAPALHNVNGFIEAKKLSGYVQLDSETFAMNFPKLFSHDMRFATANGTVFWAVNDDDIRVGSRGLLSLTGDYGNASGEFQLMIPRHKDDEDDIGRISIVVSLEEGDVAYRQYLLPYTLDAGLLDWLEQNIHGGRVRQGTFIYHGPIEDSDEQKVVQLWLDIEQGMIRYVEQFPQVEAIRGELLFDQDRAFATVESAVMADMAISDAAVDLLMIPDQRQVQVHGSLRNEPAANVMAFLQQPAINDFTKGVLADWQTAGGSVNADVIVDVPLDNMQALNVTVNAALQHVDLSMSAHALELTQINGDLRFELLKGLSSEKLTGNLWGEPVKARIVSSDNDTLFFESRVRHESLQNWLKLPELYFLDGVANIHGSLYWGKEGSGIHVQSDLQGMAIRLPEPLGKKAQDLRALTVSLPFGGDQRELQIKTDDGISLQFLLGNEGIKAGLLTMGMAQNDYRQGSIVVRGHILQADAQQWIQVVEKYQLLRGEMMAQATQASALSLHVDGLSVRHLNLWGYQLDTAAFSASEKVTGWLLELQHQSLSGSLLIDKKPDVPLLIDIDHANLALLGSMQGDAADSAGVNNLDKLPAMDVIVHSLFSGENDYGQWRFSVRAEQGALTFSDIEASVRFMDLKAFNDNEPCQLVWTLSDTPHTRFSCRFYSESIDKVLAAWGQEKMMVSKSFTLDLRDGQWLGGPADFSLNTSELPVYISANNGHFADVASTATGALKVVGVMNISNLVRRLKLDFSDLTQEGLSFDRVRGQLLLDNGVVHSVSPLTIKGSASQIKLSGMADFNQDMLDLDMSVSLPLASNLPWVVALAAGLPAAAGVFIISKLMGKQVDKLSTAVYAISGSMQDPKVRFQRFFDIGSEKKTLPADTSGAATVNTEGQP